MQKTLTFLVLVALLAVVVAGCGSSSTTSSTSTTSTSTSPSAATGGAENGGASGAQAGGAQSTTPSSGAGSPSGSQGSGSASAQAGAGAGGSILRYGASASGGEAKAVSSAAHAFFVAMANHDYAGICNAVSAPIRTQLKMFMKGANSPGGTCPAVLAKLLKGSPSVIAAAQAATKGTMTGVRIKGDTAFFLFRAPKGPLSFVALKREHGQWKAISLAPGVPVNPLAKSR